MAISIQVSVQSLIGDWVFVGDAEIERLCSKPPPKSKCLDSHHLNYNMKMSENPNFRINVIAKQDNTLRISIVVNSKTTIAKLKRTIEQEYHQLYSTNMLISVIEDSEGFVLSNNSVVGDHLRHGDSVYVQSHKQKMGTNMNLPSHLPDVFLTLRYVSGSVIKKLLQVQTPLNPLDVVPEIIHLGFWYSNFQTVCNLCKLLNKIFTPESLDNYFRQAHEMQNILLLKMLVFWFSEVKQSFKVFPEVFEELLTVLYKLSLNRGYCELLNGHKILKSVLELSKDQLLKPEMKRMAVQIIRNVTGKGNIKTKVQSSYIPTALGDSTYEFNNLEEILEALSMGTQQNRNEVLQELMENPKLIAEATVRFDFYCKLTNVFQMRSIKDKTSSRVFSQVVKTMAAHTTKEKAAQIMQKDIIKKMHYFLLQSHTDAHSAVFDYYELIMKESSSKGMFNIEQASELLSSPYPKFQKISAEGLAEMSEQKISPIRFLPSIKDYLRMSLKTEDELVSTYLMRTIGNLTLDQQCRYQIINLKGIEVFMKFLEIGQKNGNSELQRACAKGLLNLSIGSREIKAKVLGLLSGILERYYKGNFDSIAGNYIQNILKAPKV